MSRRSSGFQAANAQSPNIRLAQDWPHRSQARCIRARSPHWETSAAPSPSVSPSSRLLSTRPAAVKTQPSSPAKTAESRVPSHFSELRADPNATVPSRQMPPARRPQCAVSLRNVSRTEGSRGEPSRVTAPKIPLNWQGCRRRRDWYSDPTKSAQSQCVRSRADARASGSPGRPVFPGQKPLE